MDFGITSKTSEYYLANLYQKNKAAEAADNTSFLSAISAKAAESTTGMSFEEMWKTRYPGAYYHVMDASGINEGIWGRNDFPFEKFFSDNVDESVLGWKPNGAEPADDDSSVVARRNSTLGKKAVVVPPELEEKMKNDPKLAESVMATVEKFISEQDASVPGVRKSFLIALDKDGNIAQYRIIGEGMITGSSPKEIRQFQAEQRAKKERREEYARLAEESALKRRLQEQEADKRHYQSSIAKEAISAAYEANVLAEPIKQ